MSRYLRDKAEEIRLERGRAKDQNADATDREITQMRGVCGKLNWVAREGMPQGSGDASLLSGTLPQPKVKDLTEANAALRRLMQNDCPLKIRPIPLEDIRLLDFGDASLGNAGEGKSQIAHMICATNKVIFEGEKRTLAFSLTKVTVTLELVLPLSWWSHKPSASHWQTLSGSPVGLV